MEEHGLVERRFYSEHPPRAEYELSAKGKELGVIVGALAAWGSRHVFRRTALVHDGCGHPVKLGYFCPDCGGRVRGSEVRLSRTGGTARSAEASVTRGVERPPRRPRRSGRQ
jgi:hypothetical protein